MIDRRGFLGVVAALVAAPFVPKAAPLTYAGPAIAWDPLIHADVWSMGPPLTEERFARALGVPWPPLGRVILTDIHDVDLVGD